MNDEKYLINQIGRLYTINLYINALKLSAYVILVLSSPILIYVEFVSGEYSTAVFLFVSELIFLYLTYKMFLHIKNISSFAKSQISKCFQNQNILNKIIVSDNKILFDISDMEDEAIYIKNSEYKRNIVNSLKSVFGESKIVSNV